MNCSICGAPLPPDGICRNPHPGVPGQTEDEGKPTNGQTAWDAQTAAGPSSSEPKLGKKLSAAAWFAPVGLMGSWLLYLIQHLLVNLALPDVLAEYPILMGLGNLLRSGLIVSLCFLLYTLALKERNKAFRTAHISLSFVPIVLINLALSFKTIFRNYFDYYAEYGEELNKDSFLTKFFAQSEEPWKTVMLLDEILFFVLALGMALVSFFVARAFLRKTELAEQNGMQPLPFGIKGMREMRQSTWFAPVTWCAAYLTLSILCSGVLTAMTNQHTALSMGFDEIPVQFYLTSSVLSSCLSFLIECAVLVCGAIFYRAATGKWDKNRRDAHKDLIFLPALVTLSLGVVTTFIVASTKTDPDSNSRSLLGGLGVVGLIVIVFGLIALYFVTRMLLTKCEQLDESVTVYPQQTYAQAVWGQPTSYGQPAPYGQPTPYGQPAPYAEPMPFAPPTPYAQQPFPAPTQGHESPHAEVRAPAPDAQTGNAPSADADASANGGEA